MKYKHGKMGRRKAAVKAVIFFMAVLLSGCASGENGGVKQEELSDNRSEQETDAAEQPEKAIVRVIAGAGSGSGVLRGMEKNGKLSVLTAGHVLDYLTEGEPVSIGLEDGTEWACDSYERSDTVDVAVLWFSQEELLEKLSEGNHFVQESKAVYDSMMEGDICIAIGCEDETEKSATTGELLDNWIYMEDYQQYMMWVDAPIHPGMSGGGLFSAEGYFLGILSGGSEDGQLAAVPLSLILSEFHNSLD